MRACKGSKVSGLNGLTYFFIAKLFHLTTMGANGVMMHLASPRLFILSSVALKSVLDNEPQTHKQF